jgi:hypothetical protein
MYDMRLGILAVFGHKIKGIYLISFQVFTKAP